MDIQNFIDEFKKTFIYDMLCESLEDEQLFEHTIVDKQVIWMKEQTRQMWSMWQTAKVNAIPKGLVLVPQASANYIYNTVPELGFEHQDIKDTVLYHLNYMASKFRNEAAQFVADDHAQQKSILECEQKDQQRLEKLIANKPTGATIVAVKGSGVSYFKEDGETDLLKFNRNCWVNTWFKQCHLTLQHFDFISVIEEQNHAN